MEYASRQTPYNYLLKTYEMTRSPLAGVIDGKLVALMGIVPVGLLTGEGCPWMLGTEELKKHGKIFVAFSKPTMISAAKPYTTLRNYVDVRNKQSIRWLKWLGFTIKSPVIYGPYSKPFYPFEMRK